VERRACSNWPNAWSIVSFSSASSSAGIKIISPNSASRFIIGIESRSTAHCKAVQDVEKLRAADAALIRDYKRSLADLFRVYPVLEVIVSKFLEPTDAD